MARSTLIASLALGAAIPASLIAGAVWAQGTGEQLIPLRELKARQAERAQQAPRGTIRSGTNSQFPVIADPAAGEGPVIIEAPLPEGGYGAESGTTITTTPAPESNITQEPVTEQPVIEQPEPARTVTEAPAANANANANATADSRPKARASGKISPAAIEAAGYEGGPLPDGASPLGVKVQVLLDRAGISPGVVDGVKGGMTESALMAFEEQQGLPVDGRMDPEVWRALGGDVAGSITSTYTITQADTEGLSAPLPTDYAELAKLDQIGFTSVSERLAERFHMDEGFLKRFNPGARFVAGETLNIVEPGQNQKSTVARIELDKKTRRLRAFDEAGRMITNYPVTIGSASTPSPSGTHTVTAVAPEPTYTYNPKINFTQGDNKEVLILPPGPNGPVGSTWIDLSKPTYGIHGTSTPSRLFANASNGCVRLTNWDAEELSKMVREGTTVTFLD